MTSEYNGIDSFNVRFQHRVQFPFRSSFLVRLFPCCVLFWCVSLFCLLLFLPRRSRSCASSGLFYICFKCPSSLVSRSSLTHYPLFLCTTGLEGSFWLVEAKLVKLGTGTLAMHKFGKTGYWYDQEVFFLMLPVPGSISRAVLYRTLYPGRGQPL